MKSRFHVLTSDSDRPSRAYFRSGGAVGILLTLLALNTLQLPSHTPGSLPVDLFAMEIDAAQPTRVNELAIASLAQPVAGRTNSAPRASTPDDEFAFGPYYTVEPTWY